MTTPFKRLCNEAGLYSVQEVTDFLNIRPATARQYWYAESLVPEGIIEELFDEYRYRLEMQIMFKAMPLDAFIGLVQQGLK